MLASFHRTGGLATASRTQPSRSGVSRRLSCLYSKFSAFIRRTLLCARALAEHAADLTSLNAIAAGRAGLAIACISSRHHTPGAQ